MDRWDAFLAAGKGTLTEETAPSRHLAFSATWLRQLGIDPEQGALVPIRDDAMAPTLRAGDLVMADRNRAEAISGRVYAYEDRDGTVRTRRLERFPTQIVLRADNPAHQTEIRSGADMDTFYDEIIGEVVWSCRTW
nr:S24 family peptidase [Tropicimonas isoalkanivorans]